MKRIALCLLLLAVTGIQNLLALPGIKPYLPDTSGEYIYYRDDSFPRDSYIGFLYYDEGTYAVRYYAPAVTSGKTLSPSKSLEILFSMDTTKNYVSLTGERIISSVTPDDTDLINYLHDLMYELASRRQKAGSVTDQTLIQEDYPQFGGLVTIKFDPSVPLFNIRSISSSDGTLIFQSVSAGQLISSNDNSFSDFTGIPRNLSDTLHTLKINKKAEKKSFTYSNGSKSDQTVQLDTSWSQSMDNLWLLGSSAVLSMNIITKPANAGTNFLSILSRKLSLGTENSYADWTRISITKTSDRLSINNTFYQPLTGSITKDFKIVTALPDGNFAFFTLTIFAGAYNQNTNYFTSILNSYKITTSD